MNELNLVEEKTLEELEEEYKATHSAEEYLEYLKNKKLLLELIRSSERCIDKDGSDITLYYEELAKLITPDEHGIKKYKGREYAQNENGKWYEYPPFDLVLCWNTEAKVLFEIDKHVDYSELAKKYAEENNCSYITAYMIVSGLRKHFEK